MKYRRDQAIDATLREGEPFFLLRGQDLLAIPALVHYARLANKAAPDVAQGVNAIVVEFAEWQSANPDYIKVPD